MPVTINLHTSKQGITWAAGHIVGTGPFILQEYKRDVSMTFVKNPNYWQAGKPYLDGIEFDIIPDATTASALFQAGDVDLWYQGNAAQDWQEMAKKGFHVQNYWPGLPRCCSAIPSTPIRNGRISGYARRWNTLLTRMP